MKMNKTASIVKTLALVLLMMGLCVAFSSCKESSEPEEPAQEQTAPAPPGLAEEPAEPSVEKPAQEPAEQPAQADPSPAPADASPAPAAPAGWVPIDIKLPKPMFVGTPQDTRVPNLRKPRGKARPPFLAPPGTTNVALNKPVSASDEEPIIGEIEYITDGDKEAADGSYVELGPFLQHVQVDLEAECEIYAIVVWHYHKQPCVYFDVIAQMANDKDFISDVKTVFNNDIDNSAGMGVGKDMHYTETAEGELIDCKGVRGRYVRLYSNGNTSNDLNHYIEVDVYGKPVQ